MREPGDYRSASPPEVVVKQLGAGVLNAVGSLAGFVLVYATLVVLFGLPVSQVGGGATVGFLLTFFGRFPPMQIRYRRGGGEIELVGKTWRGQETRRTYRVESIRGVTSWGDLMIELKDGTRHRVANRWLMLPPKVAAPVVDALNHAITEARSDVRVRVPIDDAGLDAALGGSRSPADPVGDAGEEEADALRHEPSRRTLRRGRRPR